MGNQLCAPWRKGYVDDERQWTPRKDSHLLRSVAFFLLLFFQSFPWIICQADRSKWCFVCDELVTSAVIECWVPMFVTYLEHSIAAVCLHWLALDVVLFIICQLFIEAKFSNWWLMSDGESEFSLLFPIFLCSPNTCTDPNWSRKWRKTTLQMLCVVTKLSLPRDSCSDYSN